MEKIIRDYREKDRGQTSNPANQALVATISSLRLAALRSFWTDQADLFPTKDQPIWWEVWLRVGTSREKTLDDFCRYAKDFGMDVQTRVLHFRDRMVLLACGTPEQMTSSALLLDCVAELRKAKDSPAFFLALRLRDQVEWLRDLQDRLHLPGPENSPPAVCLLDTGVNRQHPLLVGSIPAHTVLTCEPIWGVDDRVGHGTEMAGLALFGDLMPWLEARGVCRIEHVLESVKLLPPRGSTSPELYGKRTQEAFARIEIEAPMRNRVFCMAVTAPDHRDHGVPSSWSASIDVSSSGMEDDKPRLVVISAGNVQQNQWHEYPERNDIEEIHDPGQAWNALTVGAYTEKVNFDPSLEGVLLAEPGGLSPSSTTSVAWGEQWPNKPDIVLEGGNALLKSSPREAESHDSLLLLTTHVRPFEKLFITTGDTSAAAALASRMAAILCAEYPHLWPETIRGLLVHSATWTESMKGSVPGQDRNAKRLLLRRYGYGVPSLERARFSASNSLGLLLQGELQPFEKCKDGIRFKEMEIHELPWPRSELLALGATPVELRVTLSYFIEPNPARRGWGNRFRYPSHGLRFKLCHPNESLEDFRSRVTKSEEEGNAGVSRRHSQSRYPRWELGSQLRDKGSIHSDRWTGTAADLATCHRIAVYPVGGWWKENPSSQRWEKRVRYALLVTIQTPPVSDIYTPVLAQISARIPVLV